ncbi:hypothetical protein PENSPDRAFT_689204 [Peniophora sp. CONT]|nr:hypothetical protein PENSPDRAFT_689204 [Peniophora sp. CONT]
MKNKENNPGVVYQTAAKPTPTPLKFAPPVSPHNQPQLSHALQTSIPARPPTTSRQFLPLPPSDLAPRSPLRASAPAFYPFVTAPLHEPTPIRAHAPLQLSPALERYPSQSIQHSPVPSPHLHSPRLIPVYYAPPSRANDPPSPLVLPPPPPFGQSSRDALAAPQQLHLPTIVAQSPKPTTDTLVYTYSDIVKEGGSQRACIGTWWAPLADAENRADNVYAGSIVYGALLAIVLAVEDALPFAKHTPVAVLTTNHDAIRIINTVAQPTSGTPAHHIRTLIALSGAQICVRLADDAKGELTHKEWAGARALARAVRHTQPRNIVLNVKRRIEVMERIPPSGAPQRPLFTSTTPKPIATDKRGSKAAPAPTVPSIYVSGRLHGDGMSALVGMWHAPNDERNLSGRFACSLGGSRMAALLAIAAGVEAAVRLVVDGGLHGVEVVCADVENELVDYITSGHPIANLDDHTVAEVEAIRHIRRKLELVPSVHIRRPVHADLALGVLAARVLGEQARESDTVEGRWVGGNSEETGVVGEVGTVEEEEIGVRLKDVRRDESEPTTIEHKAVVFEGDGVAIKGKEVMVEEAELAPGDEAVIETLELPEGAGNPELRIVVQQMHALYLASPLDDRFSKLQPSCAPVQHDMASNEANDSLSSTKNNEQPPMKLSRSARRRAARGRRSSTMLPVQPDVPVSRPGPASFESLAATVHALRTLASSAHTSLVTAASTHQTPPNPIVPSVNVTLARARAVIEMWNAEKERWSEVLPRVARQMAGKAGGGVEWSVSREDMEVRKEFCRWVKKLRQLDAMVWPDVADEAAFDERDCSKRVNAEGALEQCDDSQVEQVLVPTATVKVSKAAQTEEVHEPMVAVKLSKAARRRRNRRAREDELARRLSTSSAIVDDNKACQSSLIDARAAVDVDPIPPPSFSDDHEADGACLSDEVGYTDGVDDDADALDDHERAELARAEELLSRWDELSEDERRVAEASAQKLVKRLLGDGDGALANGECEKDDGKAELNAFLEEEACVAQKLSVAHARDRGSARASTQIAKVALCASQTHITSGIYLGPAVEELFHERHSIGTTLESGVTSSAANNDAEVTHSARTPVLVFLSPSATPPITSAPDSADLNKGAAIDPWSAIAAYGESSDDEDDFRASSVSRQPEMCATASPAPSSSTASASNSDPSIATFPRPFVVGPIAPFLQRNRPAPLACSTNIGSPVTPARGSSLQPSTEVSPHESRSDYMTDVQSVQSKVERQVPLTSRESALLEKHTAWVSAASGPHCSQAAKLVAQEGSEQSASSLILPKDPPEVAPKPMVLYISSLLFPRSRV